MCFVCLSNNKTTSPHTDAAVQETRKLLQGAYLLQESQPLWAGAPALLQFDRRLGRVTEDTPDEKQLKRIDYSSQFETLEQLSSEVETLSIKSFLNSVTKQKGHFFLIKGPPGSGKTALLQRVCAFWARGFCLRKFTLVLWLSLSTYPELFGASLKSLLNYCLPQNSHIDSIVKWMNRHEPKDVLVVIDGLEDQGLHFLDNVFACKELMKATVIVAASNTPMQPEYSFLHEYQTQYHLLGLSEEQLLKQVIHHYHHNTTRAEEFLMYISETHTIRALCSSPPYLATILFVFDSVATSDLPNTWTQLFTRLLEWFSESDHDTHAILTSKAYTMRSTNSIFDWQHCFTNLCTRITSPYRTMVEPANHCRFTLPLLQHYLCARHIHTLPHEERMLALNEETVPLHVRQFYIGLCSSSEEEELVLKYPATLMSAAYISDIPLEGLQGLMSSQLTFANLWLTRIDLHFISQIVYYSGLPCKLQFHSCCFGVQAVEMIMKKLLILPSGGTVQELR